MAVDTASQPAQPPSAIVSVSMISITFFLSISFLSSFSFTLFLLFYSSSLIYCFFFLQSFCFSFFLRYLIIPSSFRSSSSSSSFSSPFFFPFSPSNLSLFLLAFSPLFFLLFSPLLSFFLSSHHPSLFLSQQSTINNQQSKSAFSACTCACTRECLSSSQFQSQSLSHPNMIKYDTM